MVTRDPYAWLCGNTPGNYDPCTAAKAVNANHGNVTGHNISYCLSQPVTETCELQFSSLVLVIVIICNFVKCSTMLLILWKANEPPLVTLGDCIAAYLEVADNSTDAVSLLDKQTILKGQWQSSDFARQWDPRRRFWFSAASTKRWIIGTVI